MRTRTAFAAFTATIVLVGAGLFAIWRLVDDTFSLAIPGLPSCVVDSSTAEGPSPPTDEVTLVPSRMANAATIAAVGLRRGLPRRAMVVALATALQESKLDNLSGGDRDSIGLFQQRPSQGWGTSEQVGDPRYAAAAFYTALLRVSDWQTMRVTDAAQAVQRSAHPELYEKWAPTAEVLVSALAGDASGAVACTLPAAQDPRGSMATASVTADLRLDWGDVATDQATDPLGVVVPVANVRSGWQYAHWLVSHAHGHGVTRVRFDDQEWTARKGNWRRAETGARAGGKHVLADVIPS
ncbi:MAG: hypothetical protein HKP61_22075 [Dactylosporangium sp.]|nr:hypothetical protein [Dactylosporangium sp.]NNJ63566.1 hypothetical protein [Dactylosporangium sp.]